MLDFGKKESLKASISDDDAEVLVDNRRDSNDSELMQVDKKGKVSNLQLAEKFRQQ